jgi:imidazolonepropionase-like amidohydrolase
MKNKMVVLCCIVASMITSGLVSAETSLTYDWLTDDKRIGGLEVKIDEQKKRLVEFEYKDKDGHRKVTESYKLNDDGFLLEYLVSGHSYRGKTLNETFSIKNQIATWKNNVESGSEIFNKGYYLPFSGTPFHWAELVSLTAKQKNNTQKVFPVGHISTVNILTKTFSQTGKSIQVSLVKVLGRSFDPYFIWLDDTGTLFAEIYPYGTLISSGWESHLSELKEIQKDALEKHWQQVAEQYSHKLTKPLLIKNAQLFDSVNLKLVKNTSVLIVDGKVAEIGNSADLIEKNGSMDRLMTLDAEGRTLMPGLWDMHNHLNRRDGLVSIAGGVTHTRDLGNYNDRTMQVKADFDNQKTIGPRLYLAGFLDKKSDYSGRIGKIVTSLDEAIDAVNWYADNGYIQIKLYASISPDWIEPIAKQAHKRGLRVSGHIPAFVNASQAVKLGFDEINHSTMIFLNFLVNNDVDTRTRIRFTAVAERAGEIDLSSKQVQDFFTLLKSHNTVVDPTVMGYIAMFEQQEGQMDPRYKNIAKHFPEDIYRWKSQPEMDVNESNYVAYKKSADKLLAMVKELHDQGIPIVPGTDSIPAFTLYSELAAYVKAGISTAEVLQIATLGSARVLGVDKQFGSVHIGGEADLILIEGNPLKNIDDIRKINLVIKADTYYYPNELHQQLGIIPFVTHKKLF